MKNFKDLLKPAFVIAVVSTCLYSCDEITSPDNKINKLKKPIILISKSKEGDIVVKGGDSKILTINRDYFIAISISNTFEIGDTIIK